MIFPPPRSIIDGTQARLQISGPVRLTASTRFHQSSGNSSSETLRRLGHQCSVVDEDVDAAERLDCLRGHAGRRLLARHVDRDAERAQAAGFELGSGSSGSVRVEIGQHHCGAGFSEGTSVLASDPAGATGDDRDLAGEREVDHVSLIVSA
jgi:hypothetical protein